MPSEPGLIHGIPTRARRSYRGYIFDLDGTTYLGDSLLPTVADTIDTLRKLGRRIAFLSHNIIPPIRELNKRSYHDR